jgi:hypothetical protein
MKLDQDDVVQPRRMQVWTRAYISSRGGPSIDVIGTGRNSPGNPFTIKIQLATFQDGRTGQLALFERALVDFRWSGSQATNKPSSHPPPFPTTLNSPGAASHVMMVSNFNFNCSAQDLSAVAACWTAAGN